VLDLLPFWLQLTALARIRQRPLRFKTANRDGWRNGSERPPTRS
jgi:hypothetical protein